MRRGLDTLLFNLLVLGSLCDKLGRLWRRRSSDLYIIETTTNAPLPTGFSREEEAQNQEVSQFQIGGIICVSQFSLCLSLLTLVTLFTDALCMRITTYRCPVCSDHKLFELTAISFLLFCSFSESFCFCVCFSDKVVDPRYQRNHSTIFYPPFPVHLPGQSLVACMPNQVVSFV